MIESHKTLGWRSQTQKDIHDMVMVPFTYKKFKNRQNQSVVLEARIASRELDSARPFPVSTIVFKLACSVLSNEHCWGLWGSVIQIFQMPWRGWCHWLKGDKKDSPGASNVYFFFPSWSECWSQCSVYQSVHVGVHLSKWKWNQGIHAQKRDER